MGSLENQLHLISIQLQGDSPTSSSDRQSKLQTMTNFQRHTFFRSAIQNNAS